MSIVKKPNGTVAGYALPSILDEFFNKDVFYWGSNYTNRGTSTPAVNIRETPEAFNVEMAAPGMDKKDFKIELDRHILTTSAEKQDQNEPSDGELYNRKEFSYQSFYRTFHLPKDMVDGDKIKAKYENGLLQLEIPKREEAKQKPARFIDIS